MNATALPPLWHPPKTFHRLYQKYIYKYNKKRGKGNEKIFFGGKIFPITHRTYIKKACEQWYKADLRHPPRLFPDSP